MSLEFESSAEPAVWLQPPKVWAEDVLSPNIIYTDTAWHLHVQWETHGIFNALIAGTFHLHVYLERMGPDVGVNPADQDIWDGADLDIPTQPPPGLLNPLIYDVHIDVPAAKIPAGAPHSGRLYKPILTMTFKNSFGQPAPAAAYAEGPILQFFNPSP